ncbi:hypothetical protein D3C87_1652110 [compost metagenome]
MERHLILLGAILVLGGSGCGSAPMSVSQANSTLLLPPNQGTNFGSGTINRNAGDATWRGGAVRGRVGITALRNNITQGILAAYPSSPDNSYSVSNLIFAEPEGAWQQMPFRATLSQIGIAGPGYPVSQVEVTGIYDRLSQRVINLVRAGAQSPTPALNQPAIVTVPRIS